MKRPFQTARCRQSHFEHIAVLKAVCANALVNDALYLAMARQPHDVCLIHRPILEHVVDGRSISRWCKDGGGRCGAGRVKSHESDPRRCHREIGKICQIRDTRSPDQVEHSLLRLGSKMRQELCKSGGRAIIANEFGPIENLENVVVSNRFFSLHRLPSSVGCCKRPSASDRRNPIKARLAVGRPTTPPTYASIYIDRLADHKINDLAALLPWNWHRARIDRGGTISAQPPAAFSGCLRLIHILSL